MKIKAILVLFITTLTICSVLLIRPSANNQSLVSGEEIILRYEKELNLQINLSNGRASVPSTLSVGLPSINEPISSDFSSPLFDSKFLSNPKAASITIGRPGNNSSGTTCKMSSPVASTPFQSSGSLLLATGGANNSGANAIAAYGSVAMNNVNKGREIDLMATNATGELVDPGEPEILTLLPVGEGFWLLLLMAMGYFLSIFRFRKV